MNQFYSIRDPAALWLNRAFLKEFYLSVYPLEYRVFLLFEGGLTYAIKSAFCFTRCYFLHQSWTSANSARYFLRLRTQSRSLFVEFIIPTQPKLRDVKILVFILKVMHLTQFVSNLITLVLKSKLAHTSDTS